MTRRHASLLTSLVLPVAMLGSVLAPSSAHAAASQAGSTHRHFPRPHRTGVPAPATTPQSVIDAVVPLHVSAAAQQAVSRLAHGHATALVRRSQLRALSPSRSHALQVTAWALGEGFEVTSRTPWSVSVRGRADALAHAFGTSLGATTFHGRGFVTPRRAPAVPLALRGLADPVVGLDTRPIWTTHAVYGGGDVQVINSSPVRGSTAGTGATVATVNLSGWHTGDLATYRKAAFGTGDVPPAVTPVIATGGHALATAEEIDFGAEVEVALDAEAIAGVAPGAAQRMYFGGNSTAGYVAVLNKMKADLLDTDPNNDFQTASTSWGTCEIAVTDSELNAMRTAITAITAAGATFFAASGDSGAYGCSDPGTTGDVTAVDFPASAEDAVAVGGTTVTGSAPSYTSKAWTGSGGGCSARVPARPLQAVAGNPCAGRAVPDIAALADPSSGFWVYDSYDEWVPVGGTSLAAPVSAAGLAVAMKHAGVTSLATVPNGFLGLAYQHPTAFDDVILGDNGVYRAGAGYDLVTGLGSPRWTEIEAALTGLPAPVPSGHNEPLLAVDPSSDPYGTGPGTTNLAVLMPDGATTISGFSANGEPVTGYAALAAYFGTSNCAATTAAPPSTTPVPGLQGVQQISLSMATSDPDVAGGCLTVSRPLVIDSVAPVVPVPVAKYVGTTKPAYRFAWVAATDPVPGSGIVMYAVFVRDATTDEDVYISITSGRVAPYADEPSFSAVAGHVYVLELLAADAAWNVNGRSAVFTAPYDDSKLIASKHLSNGRYVSDWARSKAAADYLGSHLLSVRKGASLSMRFTGKTVTLGVLKSPYGGYADVYLDGVRKTRISLYASRTLYRQALRVISLSTRGTHTVKVVVTGSHPSASKGNGVYLDSVTLA